MELHEEYWSLATKESSSHIKSFWAGKFLQHVLTIEKKSLHGPLRDCKCLSDQDTCSQCDSKASSESCRVACAKKYLQEKETSLSPSVYALVTQTISRLQTPPTCSEVQSVGHHQDHPIQFLLKDATLCWSTIETYLIGREAVVDGEEKDVSAGGRKCSEVAYHVQQELFQDNFRLLKELTKEDNFIWTHSPQLFVGLLEELRTENPLRVNICLLVGTAALERALGDVYLSVSGASRYPPLLRDLLGTQELEHAFGSTAVFVLCSMIGPPSGLNLRNILWHGFASHTEIIQDFAYFLLVLISSLGQLLSSSHIPSSLPLSSTPSSLPVCHRLYTTLPQAVHLTSVFPDIRKTDLSVVNQLMENSFFILPTMLPTWKAALDCFNNGRYDYCLVVLLPCLEHGLRRVFACVNSCPQRVLTAESTSLFTTFDKILSTTLPDGNPNKLIAEMTMAKFEMLRDVLVYPEGPRIRDRISHGEVDIRLLSKPLANHVLSLCMLFCAQYSLVKDLNLKTPINSCISVETHYVSIFHPLSLLKKELIRLALLIVEWKEIPTPDFATSSVEDLSARGNPNKTVPHFETIVLCQKIQEALQHVRLVGTSRYQMFDSHSYLEQTSKMEFLKCLVSDVWNRELNTFVFMDRRDMEIIGIVRRTVSNAEKAVRQIQDTASIRFTQYMGNQLRSRQRPNYDHLLSSLGVYQSSVVFLIVLSIVVVSNIPCGNQAQKLIKYQKKLLQFAENFASQSSASKNRWEEVDKLCLSLFELEKVFPL